MAPTTPSLINPSLRTNGGDDGAAGALASATSAEKKQGSRAPRGPKVSNNFGSVPTRRNPARGAKIDGGVAEAEAAGGSPRKKPRGPSPRKKLRGEETFLLRLDRAKATAKRGRTEPIGLEDPQGDPQGDPDDRTETGGPSEGGRPEKVPPRTTKPPPVTQEDAGAGDLDSGVRRGRRRRRWTRASLRRTRADRRRSPQGRRRGGARRCARRSYARVHPGSPSRDQARRQQERSDRRR